MENLGGHPGTARVDSLYRVLYLTSIAPFFRVPFVTNTYGIYTLAVSITPDGNKEAAATGASTGGKLKRKINVGSEVAAHGMG